MGPRLTMHEMPTVTSVKSTARQLAINLAAQSVTNSVDGYQRALLHDQTQH